MLTSIIILLTLLTVDPQTFDLWLTVVLPTTIRSALIILALLKTPTNLLTTLLIFFLPITLSALILIILYTLTSPAIFFICLTLLLLIALRITINLFLIQSLRPSISGLHIIIATTILLVSVKLSPFSWHNIILFFFYIITRALLTSYLLSFPRNSILEIKAIKALIIILILTKSILATFFVYLTEDLFHHPTIEKALPLLLTIPSFLFILLFIAKIKQIIDKYKSKYILV